MGGAAVSLQIQELSGSAYRAEPFNVPIQKCKNGLPTPSADCIATTVGHSPVAALVDPAAASRTAVAEALSNIVFAPIKNGLSGISLSANWMWACNNEGEDARLYEAVQSCSDFAIALGINIPTGKDSLSMKQKYPDGDVIAPGTVIISAAGNCTDINNFKLGVLLLPRFKISRYGSTTITDAAYFRKAFNTIQDLITADQIAAGHDVGSGGLVTTLLELCFADVNLAANYDLSGLQETDSVKALFNENIAVVLQAKNDAAFEKALTENGIEAVKIGEVVRRCCCNIQDMKICLLFNVAEDKRYLV
ncbi:hypothetical protein FQR65_LT15915 [Abscondita terminalis]|nr:hypothetical protein FQR65_LT15915 [Abscondita terminalis]